MEAESYNLDENNEIENPKRNFWKIMLVFLFLIFGFLVLFTRLFFLQVVDSSRYKEMARHQHESRITIKSERGDIYDRNGLLLASTIHSISFAVDPTMLKDEKDKQNICFALENALGIPYDKSLDKINNTKGSFVWLVRTLLPSEGIKLDSINSKAFLKIEEPKRNYLYGLTGNQVIGTTDIDNKGLTGIEYKLDSLLKGNKGIKIMLRDALGRLMPTNSTESDNIIQGKNIKLTIDIQLQKIIEYELKQGLNKSGSANATAVAVDPKTGEILGMSSIPALKHDSIGSTEPAINKNRAITDVYEPGSTFKLITAAAALEERIVAPSSILDGYNGLMQFSDVQIKDEHPVAKVPFKVAMEKSSNIIFANVAYNIPTPKFYKYIRDFGFGLSSGIDLPGEVPGTIKKPSEMEGIAKRFIGFGYGIAATPLQVVMAYATIANKGVMMKPHIIKSIYDYKGREILKSKPERIRQVVSERTAEELTEMLTNVVNSGTGTSAKIEGVDVAGKTGTTQQLSYGSYSKSDYYASFVGYFPANEPKIVLLIVLDKPTGNYYGGSTAAPIFNAICKSWISMNPDLIRADNKPDDKTVVVPNLIGRKTDDAELILSGMKLEAKYSGNKKNFVAYQSPLPNSIVKSKSTVDLSLSDEMPVKNNNEKRYYVIGMQLRDAVSHLHKMGIFVKVIGTGKVFEQSNSRNSEGKALITLKCR